LNLITLFEIPIVDFDSATTGINYKFSIMNKAYRSIFHASKNLSIGIDRDGVQPY
jgi:hypothetical protein